MPDQINFFIAVGGGVDHYDLLGPEPVHQWDGIQKFLNVEWKSGDRVRLSSIDGCLEKLSTSLLHVSRIKKFHDSLVDTARTNIGKGGEYTALRGDVARADFESLLLQGRAALDRLTWFVAREFRQSCASFRRLGNILKNFEEKSDIAQKIMSVIDESTSWVNGLLATIESGESFRDFVAHKGATTERMSNCFGITFLDNRRALIFDCELGPFPIFRTSMEAVHYLSFIVLNILSTCISHPMLSFDKYRCQWRSRTVVFSDFVIKEPEGSPLRDGHLRVVKHMNPDGFVMGIRNVDQDIYQHAVDFGKK